MAMRRWGLLTGWLVVAGVSVGGMGATPAAAQLPPPPPTDLRLAPSYSTFLLSSEVSGGWLDSRETLIGIGWLRLPGAMNEWILRTDLAGGFVSGWRATDGLVTQLQVGVGRALRGDYLQVGGGRYLEFFAVGGGGATGQWIWARESEERGRDWSPVVSGGIGGRLVGGADDLLELVSFEALVEQRFRLQSPRIFLRISVHRPRGGRAAAAASASVRPGGR
jgi:hypothetical protein